MARTSRKRRSGAPKGPPPLPTAGSVVQFGPAGLDRSWLTRVEWVDGWTMCLIAPLGPDGVPFAVESGAAVALEWPTDLGYLRAAAQVRGPGEDRIATWILDVQRIDREQRRSAYRLDVMLPVTVRCGAASLSGTIRDLSEGGLRCIVDTQEALERGDTVVLEFSLRGVGTVVARAQVVRAERPRATELALGLVYLMVDAETADSLRRFVFEEQLRRRGAAG